MPRPNHGFSVVYYAYVTPENMKYVETEMDNNDFTKSQYINAAIEHDKRTGNILRGLIKDIARADYETGGLKGGSKKKAAKKAR